MSDSLTQAPNALPIESAAVRDASSRFWLLAAGIVGAGLAWDYLAWPVFHDFLGAFDFCTEPGHNVDLCASPFRDFTRVYYRMAQVLLTNKTPIFGYYYPPFFALLLVPLTKIPNAAALVVWGAVEVALTLALLLIPARQFFRSGRRAEAGGYMALVALSQPVLHNFRWGQVSVLITMALLGSVMLYERRHRGWAAVLLAFACAVKAYPALFGLYFLMRRDLRFLITTAAWVAVFAFVVPAFALGPKETVAFYEAGSRMVAGEVWVIRDNVGSQNFATAAMHLVFWGRQDDGWRRFFAACATLIAAAGLVALSLSRRRIESGAWEPALALLFLLLPAELETCWPHYFVFLPFCQVVAWNGAPAAGAGRWVVRGLIVASVVLSTTPLFRWVNYFPGFYGNGLLAWADLILIAPVAWQLVANRSTADSTAAPS